MALQSVKVWRDAKRNHARVYALAADGRQGIRYLKDEGAGPDKAAGTIEGDLSEEEWAEAREKAFNTETRRWDSWYATTFPVQVRPAARCKSCRRSGGHASWCELAATG
ncbi:MAG: hypothetical protein H0T73_01595 [Ardenticatenales bacterium]|nr:hypothetical protein [Ardenticatenales bacterium]